MGKVLGFQSFKILIVDDSPEDRDIYGQFLLRDIRQNYVVLGVDTGEAGLELLDDHRCDLILLDF